MLDELNSILEALVEDERFIPNLAKFMKKYTEALEAEGFTAEQAAKIAANHKTT